MLDKCDCLNDCGDDERVAKGEVQACPRYKKEESKEPSATDIAMAFRDSLVLRTMLGAILAEQEDKELTPEQEALVDFFDNGKAPEVTTVEEAIVAVSKAIASAKPKVKE